MVVNLYLVNAAAQALALIVLMLVIFVLRKTIGSRWVVLGFEALLLTVLLRCFDDLGAYFGIDIIDDPVSVVLRWIVILLFMAEFLQVWRRRAEIRRIEEMLRAREAYQEKLRQAQMALPADDARTA